MLTVTLMIFHKAKFKRRNANIFFKYRRKMRNRVKSAVSGNVGDGVVCACQKSFCVPQTQICNVAFEGHADCFFKLTAQMLVGHENFFRNLGKGEVLGVVPVNVVNCFLDCRGVDFLGNVFLLMLHQGYKLTFKQKA